MHAKATGGSSSSSKIHSRLLFSLASAEGAAATTPKDLPPRIHLVAVHHIALLIMERVPVSVTTIF
jgi:hypothetical protein